MSCLVLAMIFPACAGLLGCRAPVLKLRANRLVGVVGKQWRLLTVLVTLFTAGYFVTPFFTRLPADVINLLVACIFFFGAVYVLITVRLIYRIIEEMTT